MTPNIDPTLNSSPIKRLTILIVLAALNVVGGWTSCAGSGASSTIGETLQLVPDSVEGV